MNNEPALENKASGGEPVWIGDWIWRSARIKVNDFSYFRKEFALKGAIVSASLILSAHNFAKIYINGVKLGGHVSPAPTNPWKTKYYLAYEIAEHLTEGRNCLTVDAHYLGGNGQNFVNGMPGMRLQLRLVYADGSEQLVKSDTTWDVLKEMPHQAGTPYQQNRRMSAIENFDATKWDEAWRYAGWRNPERTAKAKLAKIGRDQWPMVRQAIPEGVIEEEIVPVKLAVFAEDPELPQVFDTGRIVSGWPKIKLRGIAGATLRMRYSEDLDENGRVKHNVTNEVSEFYYDQYTMRGDETEVWQPDFSYKAFRYVEVTGYPESIDQGGLTVCFAHTGMAHTGSFNCSDAVLNKLYAAAIYTQKNNTLGQTVDCPHREQAQYTADTDLQAELLLYNFAAGTVLTKTLQDFADAQLADGTFPFVAPINYEHPDFHIQIPEWDLHYATLLWKLYNFTGDLKLLEKFYSPMRKMTDYFIGILDGETGLVPLDKGWHISDWPYPTVEHKGEFLTVQQIKLYLALEVVVKAAQLIGKPEDAARYRSVADRLAESLRAELYDYDGKRFRDSSESAQTHQGVTAIALFAGLVPEGDRAEALEYVAAKMWECKTVLSLPLLRVLFENGREAEAFALLNRREYPGWGHMIMQGATTMWEGWDDIESHSHAWNGYPARLLQEYVVGIRAEAPGFASAVIRPYMPESLTFAEAEVGTVLGPIFAGWERTGEGGVRLRARIPDGMSARLEIGVNGRTVHRELPAGAHDFILE